VQVMWLQPRPSSTMTCLKHELHYAYHYEKHYLALGAAPPVLCFCQLQCQLILGVSICSRQRLHHNERHPHDEIPTAPGTLRTRYLWHNKCCIFQRILTLLTIVPRRPAGDAYRRRTRWTRAPCFLAVVFDFKTDRTVLVRAVKARNCIE
jgi:hypothetical protein